MPVLTLDAFLCLCIVLFGVWFFRKLKKSKKIDAIVNDLFEPDVVSDIDTAVADAQKTLEKNRKEEQQLKDNSSQIEQRLHTYKS